MYFNIKSFSFILLTLCLVSIHRALSPTYLRVFDIHPLEGKNHILYSFYSHSNHFQFPWFATTLYTVEDRDSLYQAALQQILDLCEKAKQRRHIGLNEALLRDLLRAGLSCSGFNERQKICLIAASELPPGQPIIHHELLEFWPFDCLVKKPKADDYEIMVWNISFMN